MPTMIPLRMHTTPLCLTCLECNNHKNVHVCNTSPSQAVMIKLISTHKIIGISTISRAEHSVAQTREVACTKVVIPQAQARGLCFLVVQTKCSL